MSPSLIGFLGLGGIMGHRCECLLGRKSTFDFNHPLQVEDKSNHLKRLDLAAPEG
jgi:hypothetical protein